MSHADDEGDKIGCVLLVAFMLAIFGAIAMRCLQHRDARQHGAVQQPR